MYKLADTSKRFPKLTIKSLIKDSYAKILKDMVMPFDVLISFWISIKICSEVNTPWVLSIYYWYILLQTFSIDLFWEPDVKHKSEFYSVRLSFLISFSIKLDISSFYQINAVSKSNIVVDVLLFYTSYRVFLKASSKGQNPIVSLFLFVFLYYKCFIM